MHLPIFDRDEVVYHGWAWNWRAIPFYMVCLCWCWMTRMLYLNHLHYPLSDYNKHHEQSLVLFCYSWDNCDWVAYFLFCLFAQYDHER